MSETETERRVTAAAVGERVLAAIGQVRADVARLHAELVRYGLIVWTAGNVSGRVPGAELFVIKPSGVDYDELTPMNMILCDLDGNVVEGSAGSELKPSSDTAAHAFVYRNMPEVGGVVHTHSTYATAWAARGEPIPCVITGMADEFGGEIPVGPFAIIGDDSIGRGIVATLSGHRSRAVLMRSHGVFTIGRNARDAVKAAVMTEDVARTIHIARQGGEPVPIAPRGDRRALRPLPEHLRTAFRRSSALMSAPNAFASLEVWFLTGSQHLYGPETLAPGRLAVAQIAGALDAAAAVPVKIVWKPVLTQPDEIRRTMLAANASDAVIGVIAWMHTFSPAKMWIAGLSALDKPLLHLHTQANVALPWADDRLRLHEPEPGRARRPRVRLHPDQAGAAAQDRRRARVRPAGRRAGGDLDPGGGGVGGDPDAASWPGSATTCGSWPSPRATRPRPRRCSASRSTPGASTTWPAAVADAAPADVDALVAEYQDTYDVATELQRRKGAPSVAARRRGDRARAAVLPRRRRIRRLHDQLRGPGRPEAAARPGRPAADGGRLRVRRRGRLEDGRAGPGGQGHGRRPARRRVADGGLHLRPDAGPRAHPGRAHARGLPSRLTSARPRLEIHPLASAAGGPGPAGLQRRSRARASSSRCPTCATASGSSPTWSRWCRRPSRSPGCRSGGRCGARRRTSRRRRRPGCRPARPTTPACRRRWASRRSRTSPGWRAPNC